MIDRIARTLAVGLEADQTGFDQYFQMLRNRRLRQIETVDDLAAAARIAGREVLQNLNPCRMRQRRETRCDSAAVGDAVG